MFLQNISMIYLVRLILPVRRDILDHQVKVLGFLIQLGNKVDVIPPSLNIQTSDTYSQDYMYDFHLPLYIVLHPTSVQRVIHRK